MKILTLALALSAVVLAPLGAMADQQQTSTQTAFKSSVKARPTTLMRRRIVRAESYNQRLGLVPLFMPY